MSVQLILILILIIFCFPVSFVDETHTETTFGP